MELLLRLRLGVHLALDLRVLLLVLHVVDVSIPIVIDSIAVVAAFIFALLLVHFTPHYNFQSYRELQ